MNLHQGLDILFVTPYIPSPMRVRPYALIRELAQRGHRVTLACLAQPAAELPYLEAVRPFCAAVHTVTQSKLRGGLQALAALPGRTPLSVAYTRSPAFAHTVAGLWAGQTFDLVHTEFVRAAHATTWLNGVPKVYDAVDCLALAYRRSLSAPGVSPKQRLIGLIEWLKLRDYERRVLACYDRALVSSPVDAHELGNGGGQKVHVLPNGVDLEHFRFDASARREDTLVFLGKMSYHPNVAGVLWFCREVLPRIHQQRPDVRLQIVGRDPVAQVQALASDPRIEVTGTVDDVRPYLQQAALSVNPMVSGSGIQNKLLEAMACGAPVIATRLAAAALQAKPGDDLLVADSPQEFAGSTLEALESPGRRSQLGLNGRLYVESCHNWSMIAEELESIYYTLIGVDYEAEHHRIGIKKPRMEVIRHGAGVWSRDFEKLGGGEGVSD